MDANEVLSICGEERVRFLRLQFTDIMGSVKNVEVPASDADFAFGFTDGCDRFRATIAASREPIQTPLAAPMPPNTAITMPRAKAGAIAPPVTRPKTALAMLPPITAPPMTAATKTPRSTQIFECGFRSYASVPMSFDASARRIPIDGVVSRGAVTPLS